MQIRHRVPELNILLTLLLFGAVTTACYVLFAAVFLTAFFTQLAFVFLLAMPVVFYATRCEELAENGVSPAEPQDAATELEPMVVKISKQYDIEPPEIICVDSSTPYAASARSLFSNGVIFISSEMVSTLDTDELNAVLSHEVVHIANYDSVLLAVLLTAPSLLLEDMSSDDTPPTVLYPVWVALLPIVFLLYGVGLFVSRQKEFIADRATVKVVGDETALVSALRKTSDEGATSQRPSKDLRHRGIEAFNVTVGSAILSKVKPTPEERIEKIKYWASEFRKSPP